MNEQVQVAGGGGRWLVGPLLRTHGQWAERHGEARPSHARQPVRHTARESCSVLREGSTLLCPVRSSLLIGTVESPASPARNLKPYVLNHDHPAIYTKLRGWVGTKLNQRMPKPHVPKGDAGCR